MANTVNKVIQVALNEVGYLEKKSNSQLDSKTANAGTKNYTKYARDLDNISGFYNGRKNGYDWCDVFVDWCFYKAYGVENAKKLLCQPNKSLGAGCGYSMNYYKNKEQFYTKPVIGDQIFFKNGSSITHTGLVYNVDDTYVYTVEGNTSGASGIIANGGGVCKKKYALSYNRIAGYGRPKYDVETNTTTSTTYTVVKGDTLSKIGKKLGVDWKEIAKLNNIKAPYTIHVGQVLLVKNNSNTTTTTVTVNKNPDVVYQVYAGGKWLSTITNYNNANSNGYAGIFGKEVSGIRVKLSNGKKVTVRSHISGKSRGEWLSETTKWDSTSNGYSGCKGKPTDCIAMKADGYTLKYRVHVKGGDWLGWVSKYNINDYNDGLAGVYGKPIDAVQIMVV